MKKIITKCIPMCVALLLCVLIAGCSNSDSADRGFTDFEHIEAEYLETISNLDWPEGVTPVSYTHLRREEREMKQPTFHGRVLLPLSVFAEARAGDPLAMERILRYYDGYMNKLCTRTLYELDGTPHVRVDEYMKPVSYTHLCTRCGCTRRKLA